MPLKYHSVHKAESNSLHLYSQGRIQQCAQVQQVPKGSTGLALLYVCYMSCFG